MYKQNDNFYGKYFNKKNGGSIQDPKDRRKHIWKQIWKWTKIVLFLFIMVSLLWGCVQMNTRDYTTQGVMGMTGTKIFVPGTSFEIITRSLGQIGNQTHNSNGGAANAFTEYGYTAINSWADAWTVTGSPFYGLFVYPLALLLNAFIWLFNPVQHLNPEINEAGRKSYGIAVIFAIILTVIIVRAITLLFSWKSQKNQDKMQDMQMKQAEITEKYKGKKDTLSRQKQQMELQALFKKEGASPMTQIVSSFASMPFLIAMFAVVRSSASLKIASIGDIALIDPVWETATHGEPIYFALIFVYLPLQIVSMLLPMFLQMNKQKGKQLTPAQKKSRKKTLITQAVMSVMFIIFVATVASGVAIYWIFSSVLQIVQTLGFYFYNKNKAKPGSREKERRLRQMKKQEAAAKTQKIKL